jgi:hypothetical protein
VSDDNRPPLTGMPLRHPEPVRDLVDEIRDLRRPNGWESCLTTFSTEGKHAMFWDVSGSSEPTYWPESPEDGSGEVKP